MSSVGEIYQHGHHISVVNSHAKRTAETDAAFFLPHLKPGMRLLDAGCGPGSITVGLALRVEPAHAVGIDASESVIETARSLAKAQPARRERANTLALDCSGRATGEPGRNHGPSPIDS